MLEVNLDVRRDKGNDKENKMNATERVFVSIYCMVYQDEFSKEMVNRMATGQEIYEFLIKDAGLCKDENNEVIPGDCNLWYLGCNDKYGILQYKNIIKQWDLGESSFDRVEAFISLLYLDKVFTDEQYRNLISRCYEGRKIDNMYLIRDYLIAKRKGEVWVKKMTDSGRK